jgi:hypothetical protein
MTIRQAFELCNITPDLGFDTIGVTSRGWTAWLSTESRAFCLGELGYTDRPWALIPCATEFEGGISFDENIDVIFKLLPTKLQNLIQKRIDFYRL